MSEANDATIRLLSEDASRVAQVHATHGREIELESTYNETALKPAALVEIECGGALRLGVVLESREKRISVVTEHLVDLHKLARIREHWHESDAK